MKLRNLVTLFICLQCIYSFAEIHSSDWEKFDGKWENDSIAESSFFSIEIEKGDRGEVLMEFFFQHDKENFHYYPVFAPLHEEGGECTDILWGGPTLLTHKDLDEDGSFSIFNVYKKSEEWSYVVQQIRSNSNGVILFEIETHAFPLTDDYSMKAKVEHELGLLTTTAEYCIYRFAYAVIPKSHNQMELLCLGQCKYYYGTDQNGNYGFVGGLFDSGKNLYGRNRIKLNR